MINQNIISRKMMSWAGEGGTKQIHQLISSVWLYSLINPRHNTLQLVNRWFPLDWENHLIMIWPFWPETVVGRCIYLVTYLSLPLQQLFQVNMLKEIKLSFTFIISFMCMYFRSLFVLLYFFLWPLCCLIFFDVRILITSLWYLQTPLQW